MPFTYTLENIRVRDLVSRTFCCINILFNKIGLYSKIKINGSNGQMLDTPISLLKVFAHFFNDKLAMWYNRSKFRIF